MNTTNCNCCQNEYSYSFETNWNITLQGATICPLCFATQKESDYVEKEQKAYTTTEEKETKLRNVQKAVTTIHGHLRGSKSDRRFWKEEQRTKRKAQWNHFQTKEN